jgi:hypothetical protein
MSSRPQSRRPSARRGTVYLLVLGTALMVSVLGMSTLMITRIHRRSSQAVADVTEARLYAQAALRMGLMRIENDADWRFAHPSGVWESDVPIGNGTYTLEGVDPSDNDLDDAPEDPVVLIGTGKKGAATHKTQITLAPANRGYTCLEVALHTDTHLKLVGAAVNCDQTMSTNDDADANGCEVRSDIQAVRHVFGGTYHGDVDEGVAARSLPDRNEVFAFYMANGTWIDMNNLPFGYSNLLKNPDFETGISNWRERSCTLKQDTVEFFSGAASLLVTNRNACWDGPEQVVTNLLQNGVTYELQAWIKMMSSSTVDVRFWLTIVSTGSGTEYFTTSWTGMKEENGWRQLADTLKPTWTGTLSWASLRIQTRLWDPVRDFYVDDVVFKETGSERTVFQKVLSPTSNPFGAETNPLGIYIIDLAGNDLVIKSSRIVGTLVLIMPGNGSCLGNGGPLNWEPAVPGFPALLVRDKDVVINPGNMGLSEDACQTSFNPPGTPYTGLGEDLDQNDTYPSELKGLIYGTDKIKFRNRPTLTGAVVAVDDIEIRDRFHLRHNPVYFRNPPPGFSGPEEIRILLDSAKKVLE